MDRLAAWSIDAHPGGDSLRPVPRRVERSHIELEKHLEDWIAADVGLISEGLTLVGRQVSIDEGRLDLLAIDSQDRWVVIEIKPGVLDTGALVQALSYASSISRLGHDELYRKLEPRLHDLGNAEKLSTRIKQQLDGEGEQREIAMLLVGAGIHPGLERTIEFLDRFRVAVNVVSFEVFRLNDGPQLLIRQIVEEKIVPSPPRRRFTVQAIRNRAVEVGVDAQFDRFLNMTQAAGLAVQPQRASIRVAPPANRTRFLMYAQPRAGRTGGELGIWVGPKQFAEFFPDVSEAEATEALGEYDDGAYLAGEALGKRLDQIERFLTERIRTPIPIQGSCWSGLHSRMASHNGNVAGFHRDTRNSAQVRAVLLD